MRRHLLGLVVLSSMACSQQRAPVPAAALPPPSPAPPALARAPEPATDSPKSRRLSVSTDACDRLDPGSDQLCRDRAVEVLGECDSMDADLPCRAIAECLVYRAESIKLRDEICKPDASLPECIVTQRKLQERGTVADCASRQRRPRTPPSGA